jgi:hypothetical protein
MSKAGLTMFACIPPLSEVIDRLLREVIIQLLTQAADSILNNNYKEMFSSSLPIMLYFVKAGL